MIGLIHAYIQDIIKKYQDWIFEFFLLLELKFLNLKNDIHTDWINTYVYIRYYQKISKIDFASPPACGRVIGLIHAYIQDIIKKYQDWIFEFFLLLELKFLNLKNDIHTDWINTYVYIRYYQKISRLNLWILFTFRT